MSADWLKALVMGVVEGMTEFVPVSSTGHLILAKAVLRFTINDSFEVFIQTGAMLAVVIAYFPRFAGLLNFRRHIGFAGWRGIGLLALTSAPALLVGLLLHASIKAHLFNPATVALGLGLGSLLTERFVGDKQKTAEVDMINWRQALAIGLFQCLALFPGMSRSSSTILGGMLSGVRRRAATEYSFFAAVPVLLAAGGFDLLESLPQLGRADLPLYLIGFIVSFLAAWVAVRFFIHYLARHTLVPFGWYRLGLAVVVLGWWFGR